MLNNGWLDEHILVKDKYPPSIYLGQEVLGGLDFGMFVCMQWHILGVRLKFICPFHAGCHRMMLVLYCVWVTWRSLTHRTRATVEFSAGVTLFELGMFWMLAFGVFWCRTVNLHINFRFRNSFGYKPKSETGNSRSSSVFISAALYYFHRHCHQQSTQVPVTPRQFMLIAWISDERLTYCYADTKLMEFNKLKKTWLKNRHHLSTEDTRVTNWYSALPKLQSQLLFKEPRQAWGGASLGRSHFWVAPVLAGHLPIWPRPVCSMSERWRTPQRFLFCGIAVSSSRESMEVHLSAELRTSHRVHPWSKEAEPLQGGGRRRRCLSC